MSVASVMFVEGLPQARHRARSWGGSVHQKGRALGMG